MKRETFIKTLICAAFVGFVFCLGASTAFAQTTAFTYQGKLTDGANASPTGTYDLRFSLDTGDFLVSCNGATSITFNICQDVSVVNGIFTVRLDFGAAAFTGGAMQTLGIGVRRGDETGAFTPLAPAQPITSAPYAIRSLNAAQLDGVAASNYVQTTDGRLSDARTPTAGSSFYIQNQNAVAQTASFNITGSGVVGGRVGIGTTSAPATASLQVNGGVLARGGTPGTNGASNNGYAFSGNNGDADSGMFSTAAGTLQFNVDIEERVRLTRAIALTAHNGDFRSDIGETGGAVTLQAGNGGSGEFNNGGNGGSITLQPGRFGFTNNPEGGYSNGVSGNVILAPTNGSVGIGTTAPSAKLHVAGGTLRVDLLGAAGSTQLCRNSNNEIANCSSSLRYKTNVAPFNFGLSLIKQLKPISFDWRADQMRDVGFGAEDVARINPLFVNYNAEGEVEGVKYDRLSVAFVNAFKEQQTEIERQQKQIDELKQIVCALKSDAAVCQK